MPTLAASQSCLASQSWSCSPVISFPHKNCCYVMYLLRNDIAPPCVCEVSSSAIFSSLSLTTPTPFVSAHPFSLTTDVTTSTPLVRDEELKLEDGVCYYVIPLHKRCRPDRFRSPARFTCCVSVTTGPFRANNRNRNGNFFGPQPTPG